IVAYLNPEIINQAKDYNQHRQMGGPGGEGSRKPDNENKKQCDRDRDCLLKNFRDETPLLLVDPFTNVLNRYRFGRLILPQPSYLFKVFHIGYKFQLICVLSGESLPAGSPPKCPKLPQFRDRAPRPAQA